MESSPGKDGEYENILRRDTLKSEYEPTANKAVISSMNDGNSEATRKPGGTLDREMVKIRGNNMLLLIVSSIIISFASAELMIFATPFLELVPPLQCLNGDSWEPCEKEQA